MNIWSILLIIIGTPVFIGFIVMVVSIFLGPVSEEEMGIYVGENHE